MARVCMLPQWVWWFPDWAGCGFSGDPSFAGMAALVGLFRGCEGHYNGRCGQKINNN
jgi:hypothetical protein